jgi:ribosomal RNA-processing protein 7
MTVSFRFRVYSDPDELRKKVDLFLLAYDKQEAEMKRKSHEQEVDEDGFILVKPKVSNVASIPAQPESKKRKSKSDSLTDFYRFQLKERKMAEWSESKRQQASDVARFTEMKNNSKFQL